MNIEGDKKMSLKKVFGYPQFDESGEKILTTYDGPYSDMMMDIRVYRMNAGDVRRFHREEEEMAILLQKGDVTINWHGQSRQISRKDTFAEGSWCLHVSNSTAVQVQAHSPTEILVQCTRNEDAFTGYLYNPDDTRWVDACRGKCEDTANFHINTIFDYKSAPYSNMVLGEIISERGNWTGYIPHHHPQPEVYYYLFDRPEGFGASFVGEDVYKIKDGSFAAIPGGLVHPQVSAPGYQMYTCWMIRHLDGNPLRARTDDEQHLWLNDAKF